MRRAFVAAICLTCGLASAQDDFAGLGRYAEANAELGSPAKGEDRVVFMGDSITQGWVSASPEFFAGRPYIGRGISGQTTPQMLLRFRQDVIALEPAVVVILAGTNDVAGNTGPATNEMIQDNLASMAELAAENDIQVILSSILPADRYPWQPDVEPAFRIFAINRWLEQYAEDNDHIYLDYYSTMVNDTGGMQEPYTTDGVHASKAGYEVMQELVEEAIDEALDRPRGKSGNLIFRPAEGCTRTSSRRQPRNCQ
jgi:lysophospholipase L1-like esterase